jgi:hypothetical protein
MCCRYRASRLALPTTEFSRIGELFILNDRDDKRNTVISSAAKDDKDQQLYVLYSCNGRWAMLAIVSRLTSGRIANVDISPPLLEEKVSQVPLWRTIQRPTDHYERPFE